MEVKIKEQDKLIDATIEMVDGVMVVSPKKVKFEPKDGDVCRSLSCLYIFKTTKPSTYKIHDETIIYHCSYNVEYNRLRIGEDVGVGHIGNYHRFATEEEKKLLFDKLAEEGWEWDADKKELVKIKWEPKDGEVMYTAGFTVYGNTRFIVFTETCHNEFEQCRRMQELGWCFKTEAECQAFCDKLNKAISSVKP